MIVGRGIIRGGEGYQNILRLSELAILAGQVCRSGTGILPLAMENNAFGAIEMGGVPEFLPGFQSNLSDKKGHTLLEMLDAAERGEIKALYLVGEDLLRTLPQKKVKAALQNLELLICQDLFPSETTAMAHIVFPAASYAEKMGRFTNQEGEIQKVRKAIEPIGNAKPDWMIFSILSKKLKEKTDLPYMKLIGYQSPDEIWKEIVMALPPGWPVRSYDIISQNITSYAKEAHVTFRPLSPAASNGSFHLHVGQSLYHAGKTSTFAIGLTKLLDQEMILMHPDDAERLDFEDGEIVALSGENGNDSIRLPIKYSKKIGQGSVFTPEHFGTAVKKLLPLTIDPTTHVPYGERGKVKLSKISV